MISISVGAFILWIIVGVLGLINCINGRECRWINYWLVYSMLMITFSNQIAEKLA